MISRNLTFAGLFVLANLSIAGSLANAGQVRMEFDQEIDHDGDPPTGTPPWLIATFADSGQDRVQLIVESTLTAPNEFIRRLWFNTEPDINANEITIGQVSGPPSVSIRAERNRFGSPRMGGFDMELVWGVNDFLNGNEIATFDLSAVGLTASSFAHKNEVGYQFFAVAKAANTKGQDELIAPTGIPLPSTALLGLVGLLGIPVIAARKWISVAS